MECRVDMPDVLSLPSTNGRKRSGASVSFGMGRGEQQRMFNCLGGKAALGISTG